MANKTTVGGTFEWARLFEVNRDKEGPNGSFKDVDGKTSVNLIMDADNFKKFQASGSRLKPHDNGDGTWTVTFRRDWKHPEYPNYGGQADIRHGDGSPWDLSEDGLIGNGSKGYVGFVTYDTAVGAGTRLEAVMVTDHVVYESDYEQFDFFADIEVEQPKKETKAKGKSELEDEIPY